MASFFWIGSAANWATNSWSSTSGGVSNGSQPTSADDVIFDQNSPGNCTVTVSTACRSLDFRGGNPDGTHDFAHTFKINSGIILTQGTSTSNGTLGLRLSPSMTLTFASQTSGGFTFASTSGTVEKITTNGIVMATTVFNGAGGSWQLQDAFTANGSASTTMTLTAGTLDLNGKYVTLGKLASSNSNTRTLSFNGATVELQATSGTAWNMATVTGLTLNASDGLIYMNGAQGANCTFASGSKVYGNLTVAQNNIGPTFTGSPTFGVVTVARPNMTFTAGTTMTWGSLNVEFAGILFASTASGSTYTLKCAAGISLPAGVVANQISDCIASGGIPFYAGHGAVLTNTTGWVAADPPVFPTRRPAHRIALRLCRPRLAAIAPAAQAPPPPQPAARAQRVAQPRSRAARALPHPAPALPIAGRLRRALMPSRARKTAAPAPVQQTPALTPGPRVTRGRPRAWWHPAQAAPPGSPVVPGRAARPRPVALRAPRTRPPALSLGAPPAPQRSRSRRSALYRLISSRIGALIGAPRPGIDAETGLSSWPLTAAALSGIILTPAALADRSLSAVALQASLRDAVALSDRVLVRLALSDALIFPAEASCALSDRTRTAVALAEALVTNTTASDRALTALSLRSALLAPPALSDRALTPVTLSDFPQNPPR